MTLSCGRVVMVVGVIDDRRVALGQDDDVAAVGLAQQVSDP